MKGIRYVYTFRHKSRPVEFGPHEDYSTACDAFQFRFGYWPEVLLRVKPWETR